MRLHDLADGPEGDSFAVWETAALSPTHSVATRRNGLEQLVRQPALADPWNADERDELRRSLGADACERVGEEVELALPADQLGSTALHHIDADRGPVCDRFPNTNGLLLALRLDRLAFPVLDHVSCHAIRLLADEDAVRRCGLLQPARRVHDVARDHAFAPFGPHSDRHKSVAGVDRNPRLDLLLVKRPVADRDRRSDGALGVVLMRDGSSEDGHDCVTDELR